MTSGVCWGHTACPLWVISGLVHGTVRCLLALESRRLSGLTAAANFEALQHIPHRGMIPQGSCIVPLYRPHPSVSVRFSDVYVPPPLAPLYLPVPPVYL